MNSPRHPLRILMISFDPAITFSAGEGDSFARLKKYAEFCQLIYVLVPNTNKDQLIKSGNYTIETINGGKLVRGLKLLLKTVFITKVQRVNLIVTNDATLGFFGLMAKWLFNTKLLVNVFGLEIVNPDWLAQSPLAHRLMRKIQLFVLRQSDAIRTDGQLTAEQLQAIGIPKKKIKVIPIVPSPQTLQNFQSPAGGKKLRRKLLQKGKKFLVLAVGNLITQKDFETLISAAKVVTSQISFVVFYIIGQGPLKTVLESEIHRLELTNDVILAGSKSYQEIPDWYKAADLFVLSSRHEGFPRVLMEAALAQVPIIATPVGGTAELVEDGVSGILVPEKNPEALGRAIIDLINSHPKRQLFIRQALKRFLIYCDYEKNLQKLKEFWQDTITYED